MSTLDRDLPYWIALVRFPKFGSRHMLRLQACFPTMEEAFSASRSALQAAGISSKIVDAFLEARKDICPNQEWEAVKTAGLEAICLDNPTYPPLLKQLYDPPAVLFVRGSLPDTNIPHLAVVGTRKPTNYGKQAAAELVGAPAKAGVVIVSGLAYGIDSLAHRATLEAKGVTVAVLASGLDLIYPTRHIGLAEEIVASGGALISEFPLGTPALKQHFPMRNRIIAGMARATLVIEAAERSGSLITARSAIENNREVFTVPGSIFSPLSAGPNNLLKMGAAPVTCADDLLHQLNLPIEAADATQKPLYHPGSKDESVVYAILSNDPHHIDEIISACELPAAKVTSLLTLMEMKGGARHVGGLYYTRQGS